MGSTNFSALNLSDYEISLNRVFSTRPTRPSARLPHAQRSWARAAEIAERSGSSTVHRRATSTASFHPLNMAHRRYRAAMRVLSFCGHAYVWEVPDQPAAMLPPQLAIPWHEVAQRLGRPPVLSYASYALDNWRRLDLTKPIQLDNIVLLQNFLGGLDEEWFVVVHIQIEQEAGPGLAGLLRAMKGAAENKEDEVLLGLKSLALAQTAMRDTLLRMKERCDPYVYYNRVRPYIHGWKNNPSLPNGLSYEGVEAYAGQPQQYRGETGAQSTIVPCLDAGLAITHALTP